MPKTKREEKAAEKEGDYEFKLPAFDEKSFIRREILMAKASFYTIALGLAAGALAALTDVLPVNWKVGWLALILGTLALRPLLQKLGFPDEVTSWKSVAGSSFLVFFTGLMVWILGVNLL